MNLKTRFDTGDKAFCITNNGVEQLTIGQIRVEFTHSPGRAGETMFDNYKPQARYEESYMCVETGIGSGNIYTLGTHIFATQAEAVIGLAKLREKYPQRDAA